MFQSARLKLTAWYLLIILLISGTFSVVIYRVLVNEVIRFDQVQRLRIQRRIQDQTFLLPTLPSGTQFQIMVPSTGPDLVQETEHRVLLALLFVDGGILFIAGFLGYFLAGRTLQPIQRMVEEQHRFIGDASHELRTPLTSLKSAFEVYLRSSKPTLSEAKTLIRESVTEVNKLQSLSESLLDLAQYETSSTDVPKEPLSLAETLSQAVHNVHPLAAQKKIQITQKGQKSLHVLGNAYALTNVWVILLDNAIKYSFVGSIIAIHSVRTDGSVLVSITDHGQGIASKDLPHIFDRFYRANSARSSSETSGYGLGLSIAKKIIETHKGSIRAESDGKTGTTIQVKLPIVSS